MKSLSTCLYENTSTHTTHKWDCVINNEWAICHFYSRCRPVYLSILLNVLFLPNQHWWQASLLKQIRRFVLFDIEFQLSQYMTYWLIYIFWRYQVFALDRQQECWFFSILFSSFQTIAHSILLDGEKELDSSKNGQKELQSFDFRTYNFSMKEKHKF